MRDYLLKRICTAVGVFGLLLGAAVAQNAPNPPNPPNAPNPPNPPNPPNVPNAPLAPNPPNPPNPPQTPNGYGFQVPTPLPSVPLPDEVIPSVKTNAPPTN